MSEIIDEIAVRNAIAYHTVMHWRARTCAICDDGLYYQFPDRNTVVWDPRCQCSPESAEPLESSHQRIADYINAHRAEERERLWRDLKSSGRSK